MCCLSWIIHQHRSLPKSIHLICYNYTKRKIVWEKTFYNFFLIQIVVFRIKYRVWMFVYYSYCVFHFASFTNQNCFYNRFLFFIVAIYWIKRFNNVKKKFAWIIRSYCIYHHASFVVRIQNKMRINTCQKTVTRTWRAMLMQ